MYFEALVTKSQMDDLSSMICNTNGPKARALNVNFNTWSGSARVNSFAKSEAEWMEVLNFVQGTLLPHQETADTTDVLTIRQFDENEPDYRPHHTNTIVFYNSSVLYR